MLATGQVDHCELGVCSSPWPPLTTVIKGANFTALVDPQTGWIDLAGRGIIVGAVYPRNGAPQAVEAFDTLEIARIVESGGRRLIDQYWGGYVAFLLDGNRCFVVREPSGAVQCVYTQMGEGFAFSSDAELLARSGGWIPQIAWGALGRQLYTAGLPSTETALEGLCELLPGFRTELRGRQVFTEAVWSPWDHIGNGRSTERRDELNSVRRAVEQAVAATSRADRKMLVGVSGGLDSSIVAAQAARCGTELIAVTLMTDEADGDEYDYAKHLCDALGLPLLAAEYRIADVDFSRAASPTLPRPTSRAEAQAYNAAIRRIADAHGAAGFLSGNGGDNVFAYSQSASALADRLLDEGVGRGAGRTLLDICALNGCGPIAALRSAARKLPAPKRAYDWRTESMLLSQQVFRMQERHSPVHPWLDAPHRVPPGKAAHVAQLLRIQQHLHANEFQLGMEVATPLMSQPVMEACLAIPTWEWCAGGRDRSVARDAFRTLLPQAIIERRTKGGPDSFCSKLIHTRRSEIADRLLGGRIAAEGILDKAALERILTRDGQIAGIEFVRILTLLEVEAWCAHWEELAGRCQRWAGS
jgi:asparagine synthase (glutamine-hydrolysing)